MEMKTETETLLQAAIRVKNGRKKRQAERIKRLESAGIAVDETLGAWIAKAERRELAASGYWFRGAAVRKGNGWDAALPVFGRFAAIVEVDYVWAYKCEVDGDTFWYWRTNRLGGGSHKTEQLAKAAGESVLARTMTRDVEQAEQDAIEAAKKRHQSYGPTAAESE